MLRSWYRSGRIPSKMVAGVHGPQRIVPLAPLVIDQALGSPRSRRQLDQARSLQGEVEELRQTRSKRSNVTWVWTESATATAQV